MCLQYIYIYTLKSAPQGCCKHTIKTCQHTLTCPWSTHTQINTQSDNRYVFLLFSNYLCRFPRSSSQNTCFLCVFFPWPISHVCLTSTVMCFYIINVPVGLNAYCSFSSSTRIHNKIHEALCLVSHLSHFFVCFVRIVLFSSTVITRTNIFHSESYWNSELESGKRKQILFACTLFQNVTCFVAIC